MLAKIFNFYKTDIKFKNLFRLSNLFLLAILYVTAICCIILTSFEFSDGFWHKFVNKNFSEKRIVVYGVDDRIGEVMLYNRLLGVLKQRKIDYAAAKFPEYYINFFLTKHFYQISSSLINYFFKPDFNLAVTHYVTLVPFGYNIAYLNVPNDMILNKDGKFKDRFVHLADYDAYLDLYSVTNGSNPVLEEALKCHKCYDTKVRKIIPGYISHEYVDYKPASFNKVIITGSLWGCNRSSIRIANLLKRLESDDLLIAYGLPDHLGFLKHAYKGKVEDFSEGVKARDNMFKLHNDNGIALLIHNLEHMLDGLPTNRILEAAAAGAVIITDENRFITKFFGDSALYFDAFVNSDQMYAQVKAHIDWIKNNPAKAREKAKAAYEIFTDNFTIEKQLDHLIEQLAS
jgi:Glycosyl transferases group 1